MIDLEEYLVKKISERCKTLRLNLGIPMERISDRSAISRIENGKVLGSGNFITETVLTDYVSIFNKSSKEIIFGNEKELEETLEFLFGELFKLICLRNLDEDMDLYNGINNIDIETQKAVLSLAETFAEFNLKRYKFLKTDDMYMDIFIKSLDRLMWINGKFVNIARDFRSDEINEETAIDLIDMTDKMWLLCKKKFTNSFLGEVVDVIVDDFKFSSINSIFYDWIIKRFNKIIIPEVIGKLKGVAIFKIGFMVKNLISEFLDEDLSISFQNSVPIQRTRPESYQIKFNTRNLRALLGEKQDPLELINEIINEIASSEEEGNIPFDKYLYLGIKVEKVPEMNQLEEVGIENILDRAIIERENGRVLNNPSNLEWGPIYKVSDFNSIEEMELASRKWHEDKHFENQKIPGYLTNNSQILSVLQGRLNKNTFEMIEEYIDIQNNLLKLLTKKDLEKFLI